MSITLAGTLDIIGRAGIPDGLFAHYVPSLAAVALDFEETLDRVLSEPEFDQLRATTRLVLLSADQIAAANEKRGYPDIETYRDYLLLSPRSGSGQIS